MLFINPDDFIESTHATARRLSVRRMLRLATHSKLERDEFLALVAELQKCVVFGGVGADTRVIYLRSTDRQIIVREIIHGKVTTAYDIDCSMSTRDLNLELAVIDGIVCALERVHATTKMLDTPILHNHEA